MLNISRVYELMKYKGVNNLKELSRYTGIPYTTINYMLSGHDMYVGTIIELAKFFKVPVDYLINLNYNIITYREDGNTISDTSNIYEAECKLECSAIEKFTTIMI